MLLIDRRTFIDSNFEVNFEPFSVQFPILNSALLMPSPRLNNLQLMPAMEEAEEEEAAKPAKEVASVRD